MYRATLALSELRLPPTPSTAQRNQRSLFEADDLEERSVTPIDADREDDESIRFVAFISHNKNECAAEVRRPPRSPALLTAPAAHSR